MGNKTIIILTFCFGLISNICLSQGKYQTKVGASSFQKYVQIARINDVVNCLNNNEYQKIVRILENDLVSASVYKRQHVLNELAEIYSYHLLDIEKAIEVDKLIIELGELIDDRGYSLHHTGAHYGKGKDIKNIVLASISYRDKYVNLSSRGILKIASKRIRNNQVLLTGAKPKANERYKLTMLENGIKKIKKDLAGAYRGTKDYDRLLSRLMRYEFEAYKKSDGNVSYIKSYSSFLNGDISLGQVYFKEISYLKLCEYLSVSYNITKKIDYLELAFLTINKPYLKMRDEGNKITYSVLVNKIIDKIVDVNYNVKNYNSFLYYCSINKARVLAEQTFAGSPNVNDVFVFKSFTDLQKKKNKFTSFLKERIQKNHYIDFYVQNTYETESTSSKVKKYINIDSIQNANIAKHSSILKKNNLNSRAGGGNDAGESNFVVKAAALYVSKIYPDSIKITKITKDNNLNLLMSKCKNFASNLRRVPDGESLRDSEFINFKRFFILELDLYNFVNKPYKTQEKTRQILTELYTNSPDGVSGNEDCGQMSAWYIFSSLGFYPVTPGSNQYIIGSPLFDKATIHLEDGKLFTVEAKNNSLENKYIKNVQLNNKPYPYSYLKHSDIVHGGNLVFEMTDRPTNWGTSDDFIPSTEIKDHKIIPVPFIKKGDIVFKGSTLVELACADKDADVFFRLGYKGGFIKYTKPFVIDDFINLSVYAQKAGEKSAVISTDFYKKDPNLTIKLYTDYENQYNAGGNDALIDGILGTEDFRTGTWQGYSDTDLHAVVDLGKVKQINNVKLSFLRDQRSWIFLPKDLKILTSSDGVNFNRYHNVNFDLPTNTDDIKIETIDFSKSTKARYIKVMAKNYGDVPKWHIGAPFDGKAWIFVDEIQIK